MPPPPLLTSRYGDGSLPALAPEPPRPPRPLAAFVEPAAPGFPGAPRPRPKPPPPKAMSSMNDFSPDCQRILGFPAMPLKPRPLRIFDPPLGVTIALTVVRVQCSPINTLSGLSISGAFARKVPRGKYSTRC